MLRKRVLAAVLTATAALSMIAVAVVVQPAGAAAAAAPTTAPLASSPQLTVTTRLADRRSIVIGTRFYEVGAEDGTYPAMGFHTEGEMGGFWSMPIKLLDGVWFGVDGHWLHSNSYSSGWGYARYGMGTHDGVKITRTDFAPDGIRAGLIGLTLSSAKQRTITLVLNAHSELMSVYPWGTTTPNQLQANLPDTGSFSNGRLVFRDRGTPPIPNGVYHDWAAVVGSNLRPYAYALGKNFRGPQSADVVCPTSQSTAPQPKRCDDSGYGKGTGGALRYRVTVPAGQRTVWFSIGGSDRGLGAAANAQRQALLNPAGRLAAKIASRRVIESKTVVNLPGDRLLQSSIAWSKMNLADARQTATNLQIRVTNAGVNYPKPTGTLPVANWIGAGWPDYPWIFGTDGEYTAFAAVASGQFTSIENHLRTLMYASEIANHDSGKVVHEVTPSGDVYYGANADPGDTDETVKFPSAVALVWRWTGDKAFLNQMYPFTVKNMRYAFSTLDTDHDGWLTGSGNVELQGMGAEKLDVTVYAIRGLLDLATMAAYKHDTTTLRWAMAKANNLRSRFENAWWYGKDGARSYADSRNAPNQKLFQRHWIGLTPVEAELPAMGGMAAHPLASLQHARITVRQHERPCFTGATGLFHSGTGPTSAAGGNKGATCDSVVSALQSIRQAFTLTTSIAAVAEAALGRSEVRQYTDDIARAQMSPSEWETPGDMPEIAPSPDFVANIDQLFTQRSQAMQSWGTYGVLWPVVHFELGVDPDMGNNHLSVVPKLPAGQHVASASNISVGNGSVDVRVTHFGGTITTTVQKNVGGRLTIGAVLPFGAHIRSVMVDGHRARFRVVMSYAGPQVLVADGQWRGTHALVVQYS